MFSHVLQCKKSLGIAITEEDLGPSCYIEQSYMRSNSVSVVKVVIPRTSQVQPNAIEFPLKYAFFGAVYRKQVFRMVIPQTLLLQPISTGF